MTEAEKKYREEYNAKYSACFLCKLNRKYDAELIEWFGRQPNKNRAMKRAFLEYMQNHKDDVLPTDIAPVEEPIVIKKIKSAVTAYNKLTAKTTGFTSFSTIYLDCISCEVYANTDVNLADLTDDDIDLLNYAMTHGYDDLKVNIINVRRWAEDAYTAWKNAAR